RKVRAHGRADDSGQYFRESFVLWLWFAPASESSGGGLRPERSRRLGRCGPCGVPWRTGSAARRIRETLHAAEHLSPRLSFECGHSADNKDRQHDTCSAKVPTPYT